RLEQDKAKRVGEAGEHENICGGVSAGEVFTLHENICGGVSAGEVFTLLCAGEQRLRVFARELGTLRAAANDYFLAGQIEFEKGLNVFLNGNASDIEKDGAIAELANPSRAKQLGIDATRPQHQPIEAPGSKLVLERMRRHEGARRTVVKAPLQRIAPGFGDREPRPHIVGKAGVVAR